MARIRDEAEEVLTDAVNQRLSCFDCFLSAKFKTFFWLQRQKVAKDAKPNSAASRSSAGSSG